MRDLHRYVKQDLLALVFKCTLPGCDFIGKYEEMLAHKANCDFQFQQCTQGCGLGIIGKDMEYHCMKQCKLFKVTCDNCEEASYPNDPERGGKGLDGHDCIQVLKANLKAAREEIAMLRAGQGNSVGGGDVVVRCQEGCIMQKVQGMPSGYTGNPRCDHCQAEEMNTFEFFYHCPSHGYDMCRVCAMTSVNKLKVDENGRYPIRNHGCPLRYNPDSDRHYGTHFCDAANLHGPGGRCQSSISYNLSNKNQQYFYCESCNIDICVCCAERLQH